MNGKNEIDHKKVKEDGNMEKISIPKVYYPTTGYGKIIVTVKNNRIVNCETHSTHKIDGKIN